MNYELRKVLRDTPVLSKDEEIELFKMIASGDTVARDKVIEHNLRIVASISNKLKHLSSSLEYEDLIGIGTLGLIQAIESFKLSKGLRFSTFAFVVIERYIINQVGNVGRLVRVPPHTIAKHNKVLKFVDNHKVKSNGASPKEDDVIDACGITGRTKVDELLLVLSDSVSLDSELSDGSDATKMDMLTTDDLYFDSYSELDAKIKLKKAIHDIVESLPEVEGLIIDRRYGLSGYVKTFDDLAIELGVSKQAVHQRYVIAMRRLRIRAPKFLKEHEL